MLQSIDGPGTAYFELESPVRIRLDRNSLPHLVADVDRLYDVVMLVDLERWVEMHLTSWSATTTTDHDYTALASLVKIYMKFVEYVYQNSTHEFRYRQHRYRKRNRR
jgi:hypothetical protein